MSQEQQSAEEVDTVPMIVSRTIAKQLKAIASHRATTMAKTLERLGGAAILREYKKVLAEQLAEVTPVTVGGES